MDIRTHSEFTESRTQHLLLGVAGCVTILIITFLCLKRKARRGKKAKYNVQVEMFLKNHEFIAPKRYPYSEVVKMTNSFKVKLGQGGFGSVYKGVLKNQKPVAVKVLSEIKGDGQDFINEVASVGRTSHVNIVSLVGFCLEGRQRALIYEFMPNGSLERFIYSRGSSSSSQLGWEKLHEISIGIARGLEYLHKGCNTRILHFDIKPHNILLDKDFCPKISDFGLAKLFHEKESKISMSHMRGTPGYIAPELFSRNFGEVSHKSDVYSYGMMILEMVGGRKNIKVEVDHTSEIYFPHWIYKKVELHEEQLGLHGIVSDEQNRIVRKMIIVGLWCIQTNPSSRPRISKVLEMLEGDLASLEIPPKPYISSPSRSPPGSPSTIYHTLIELLALEMFLKNHEFIAPKRYSYSEVVKMTNSFKVKLGQGGFGAVYKGALKNQNMVAVKVLSEVKSDGQDFINEVASVGRTSHVNIVSLVGFCLEGRQRALIYEFMPNGSLERFIYSHGSSSSSQLGWEKLHQIAIGIARGLEYLHKGCNTRILHFDIKPHNILLDKDFCPKISDFGLAKLFHEKESKISMSHMRGTPGYIAPELFFRNFGEVSHKSDVYSYGMMILEMVGGRKNIEINLANLALKRIRGSAIDQLIDPVLGSHMNPEIMNMITSVAELAFQCLQYHSEMRPTMNEVLDVLMDIQASGGTNANDSARDFRTKNVFPLIGTNNSMTNSFKVKLGQGGFGSVYKGVLKNKKLVAVKVLSEVKGDGQEFINEVASVGRTSHVNIVSLVGFCLEGRQRALIYEFMPNGSLERFIHIRGLSSSSQLGWEKLHEIAIGIARGLEYLHKGCNTRILHFDIKPHNILLDKDFCPKISDFGLAKLFHEKESKISMSHMRGTPGYIAPELFFRNFGEVSHKSDVYSYGMMILEMVGGRKNIEVEVDHTSEIYFPHWIYKKVELHEEQLGLHGIVSDEQNKIVRKMIIVGLWCIQTNPLCRPRITKVLEMLEGDLASLEIPPKPYL
ncbi:hypothetical protein R6Q59_005381, partial [Mikania micrantha]